VKSSFSWRAWSAYIINAYLYRMYVSERETETVPMEESSSLQLSELASIHKTSPLLIYHCMQFLSLSLSLSPRLRTIHFLASIARGYFFALWSPLFLSLSFSRKSMCQSGCSLFIRRWKRGPGSVKVVWVGLDGPKAGTETIFSEDLKIFLISFVWSEINDSNLIIINLLYIKIYV
jgi:hypothetical protein